MQNLTKSIELFSDEVEQEYELSDSYKYRGDIHQIMGDRSNACSDWKKSAELGDEDAAKLLEEHCQ